MSKKIKILWLCNVIVPQLQAQLGMPIGNGGGWLVETLGQLAESSLFELGYCAPLKNDTGLVRAKYKNVRFWGFNKKEWFPHKYDASVEGLMGTILQEFEPDIVHIFGTEFPHALSMVKVFNRPDRTVIHVQGLVSVIAKHYYANLPMKAIYAASFRDIVRADNIALQAFKFEKRGIFEIQALKGVAHVMGRTSWDYACVKAINPNLQYHYCPENLRSVFCSDDTWNIEDCERFSIFMSQGSYPIKGLHLAIEALHDVKKQIPDAKLYVAGGTVINTTSWKDKLREGSYVKYIRKLIHRWGLADSVIFMDNLNAEEMKTQYLKSHVFILPSTIENSPNSLSEAMALGVPVVSAYVGGVPDMLTHNEEGFLYQADAPYMLANYILQLMRDDNKAITFSQKERERMKARTSIKVNVEMLEEIYNDILRI